MATIADAFDTFNHARYQSKVLDQVWRAAYGDEYAEHARPDAFYPLSVLDRIIAVTDKMAADRTLLDVGCGHGLTALYLARRLRARLFGIDVSPVSIELAQKNARDPNSDPRFWLADATKIGLEEGTCSLVTCLDVLLYISDKAAAFKELYRVLTPGGVLAFTTWEQSGHSTRLGADQVTDHRPLLEKAGFRVETYETVDEWRERQLQVAEGIIEHAQDLKEEVGERAASMFVDMAKGTMVDMEKRRYVFGLARKAQHQS